MSVNLTRRVYAIPSPDAGKTALNAVNGIANVGKTYSAPVSPYRPSNGTEGEWFESRFCNLCDEEAPARVTDDPAHGCPILARAYIFAIGDKGYPAEWIEDGQGPRCTAFRPEGTPSPKDAERDRERYEAAMAEMRAARLQEQSK